jgi:autotransporter-associated beta strand protein
MKQYIKNLIKTVVMLTFMLATLSAQAQFSWSGAQTLFNGDNIIQNITLTGNVTISVSSGTATISGAISGAYKLTKTGAGTLVIASNNPSFTGATAVNGGALQLGNGGTSGSIANSSGIALAIGGSALEGGDLIINRSNVALTTISSAISSSGTGGRGGSVTKRGTGILVLTGNNTYTGGTFVMEGTVQIGNAGTTGAIAGNAQVSANATLDFKHSNAYTFSGVISGAGNVTHSGAGQLILTGVNTYTGKTAVSGSRLIIASGGSISATSDVVLTTGASEIVFENASDVTFTKAIGGAGNVSKSGAGTLTLTQPKWTGLLTATGGDVFIQSATFSASGVAINTANKGLRFIVPSGQTLTYSGVISGAGRMAKYGAGTLVLNATNTFSGYLAAREGVLQLNQSAITGANASQNHLEVNAGAKIVFSPTSATTFSKVISGAGNVEQSGSQILRFTADNTYTGTTTIAGTLYIGNGGATGSVAGNITVNGGAFLVFNRSNDYTFSGVISGTGIIDKFGAGKVTLNGANTYTGETRISAGTLALGASGLIATSAGVNMYSNTAKFDISAGSKAVKSLKTYNSSYTGAEVVLGSRILTIGTSSSSDDGGGTYAGKISGTGGIYKYGTQKLTLTGTANTYSAGTLIGSGEVEFKAGTFNSASSVKIALYNNATLTWASGNTEDISNRLRLVNAGNHTLNTNGNDVQFQTAAELSGSSIKVTKTGGGRIISFASQTWTGGTDILEGGFDIAGTAGALAGNVAVSAGATLQCTRSTEYTFAGVISGAGDVRNSNGKLILTGANTCTGSLTVNADVQIGNGTTGAYAGDAEVASGKTLVFKCSNAYTHAGVISGDGGKVEHSGAGVLTLNGANTYTGATSVTAAGTLQLGATGAIESSDGVGLDAANAKFIITSDKSIKTLTGVANTQAQLNGGNLSLTFTEDNAFSGVISGTGGLNITAVKQGGKLPTSLPESATYTLNGANTYAGATEVCAGALKLGAGGSLASDHVTLSATRLLGGTMYGKLDVSSGNKTLKNLSASSASCEVILGASTLQIGTSAATGDGGGNFKGIFTGTGGVSKTGYAELSLSGANTATGMLSHAAGTIALSSKWAGSYSQASGATLDVGGNITVGGAFTLAGGGTISMDLTTATPAKINVTGTVTPSGTTTMDISAVAGNYTLIESSSGVSNLSRFSFPSVAGLTLTPSLGTDGGKTQLKLGVTVNDATAPTPGASGAITVNAVTAQSLNLAWTAATDNQSTAAQLRYFVYQSAGNNLSTVANCEANGTLLNAGGTLNIASHAVSGLDPNTTYYYNVAVVDAAGNKAVYTTKSQTTAKATLGGTVTVSGSAVYGQTLTAVTTGLVTTPDISGAAGLGTLSYQWKRSGSNISGATGATYTINSPSDIAQTITVTVSAANATGSVTSAGSPAVGKGSQQAPAAPTLSGKTHNSITLGAISNGEYTKGGGVWQSSPTFSGLDPATAYTFQQRYAETATLTVSGSSASASFTTADAPIPDKVFQGIQQVAAINAPYNSPKTAAGLGLPATVTIITDQGNVTGVAISWNVAATAYTVGADPEQTFTVTGTIALPAGVVQPASPLPLATQVSVTVAARPLNPQVTGVTVSPATVSVQKGQGQQFNASVSATDGADESVTWSVSGANSAATQISSAGYLTIAASESASALTVRASSQFNSARYGQATVTLTPGVGVENIASSKVNLYPNPAANEVFIDCPEGRGTVSVVGLDGRFVLLQNLQSGRNSVDISGLTGGIYIVKIRVAAGEKTVKLIKK